MNVIIFGATGMVGQGVLRECLLDQDINHVLTIGRNATGQRNEKLRELVHQDFQDFSSIETELSGLDACFFCLGVSSVGMTEEHYRRLTYDIAMAAAQTLAQLNPSMIFVYVSAAGADSTEHKRIMWARVRGKTENALLQLPFKAVYIFRPAAIQPLHGIVSKTRLYRIIYAMTGVFISALKTLFPQYVTTTEQFGRSMIKTAKYGAPSRIMYTKDINSF